MRLGMMQPYFFPYLGYFGLVHATDHWIVFDTPQYIRRGWVNRNRVLSSGREPWKYVRIPIRKCAPTTSIRDVAIDDRQNWRQQILNDLDAYARPQAPRFAAVRDFLSEVLSIRTESLCELLVHGLAACCDYISLPFRFRLYSDCGLQPPAPAKPGDWALHTAVDLQAEAYVNPPGGRDLFDATAFRQHGIRLQFLEPRLPPYPQGDRGFQPGLSIIDALMWNDPAAVLQMVGDYQLTTPDEKP